MQPSVAGQPRRMVIVSSNAYLDRAKDTVTSPALQDYVDSAYADGQFSRHPLKYWHKYVIGEVICAEFIQPFLVEVAEEKLGDERARQYWDECETAGNWGASIAFYGDQKAPTGNTYNHIDKVETSVLPQEYAENPLTLSKVEDDMKTKANEKQHLDETLGEEEAKGVRGAVENLTRKLTKRGLKHKSVVPLRKASLTMDPREALTTLLGMIDDESIPAIVGYVASMMGGGEPDGDESMVEEAAEDMAEVAAPATTPPPAEPPTVEKEYGSDEMTMKSLALLTKSVSDLTKAIEQINDDHGRQITAVNAKLINLERRTGAPSKSVRDTTATDSTVVKDEELTRVAKELNTQYETFGAVSLRK